MAEKISATKKNFYKGPSILWSIALHMMALLIVVGLASPYLFVPEKKKNKNILAVDLVNEKDIDQRLPDPAKLGKNQVAKPKPLNSESSGATDNKRPISPASPSQPLSDSKGEQSSPTNQASKTQQTKKGDNQQNIAKILKTIDKTPATPDDKGKATQNKNQQANTKQSALADKQLPIGKKDSLTRNEFFQLRQQIAGCWQIPAGLRDVDKTTITVLLTLAPDGKVTDVKLKDKKILQDDTKRILAESALRSFDTPSCRKLTLPKDKYPIWKTIEFTFDPYHAL